MILYGKGRSRSFRALWALHESRVDFEYITVNFGSTDTHGSLSKAYRKLNPQGKVPTLVDGEMALTEGGAILNYIGSKSPQSGLVPDQDLKLRARYDEICYFVFTELEQPLWTDGKHRFALPEAQRVPAIAATARWEFAKAQTALDGLYNGQFATQEFAVGDQFSMADILLAHTVSWAESFKFELVPELVSYRDRMMQREACKKALAQIADE